MRVSLPPFSFHYDYFLVNYTFLLDALRIIDKNKTKANRNKMEMENNEPFIICTLPIVLIRVIKARRMMLRWTCAVYYENDERK